MTELTFPQGCLFVSPATLSHGNPSAVASLALTITSGEYSEKAPKIHPAEFAPIGIIVLNKSKTNPSQRASLTRSAPNLVALPLFEHWSSVTCFAQRGLRMRIHNASMPRRLEACPLKGSKQLEVK
jgi:hypothetical protein